MLQRMLPCLPVDRAVNRLTNNVYARLDNVLKLIGMAAAFLTIFTVLVLGGPYSQWMLYASSRALQSQLSGSTTLDAVPDADRLAGLEALRALIGRHLDVSVRVMGMMLLVRRAVVQRAFKSGLAVVAKR
jgi:hypothetical protein